MKNILFILMALTLTLSSCSKLNEELQQEQAAIEYTAIWPLSGEWMVRYMVDGIAIDDNTYTLYTYNTSDQSKTAFWISDTTSPLGTFTVKSSCNVEEKIFSGQELINSAAQNAESTINITNGNVMETDSIYFEIEYADKPDVIYQVAGQRRTGFLPEE